MTMTEIIDKCVECEYELHPDKSYKTNTYQNDSIEMIQFDSNHNLKCVNVLQLKCKF